MSDPVVVSSGTVTIQSDSFNSMSNLYAPAHQLTEFGSYTYVPGTVVPPPAGIGETLVFPSSPTDAVDVDPNYGVVLIDSAGTLTGGGSYTTIISGASEFNYTGSAGQVIALGGASDIDALNDYASIVFGGIGNTAVLAGAQSTLTLDNGSTGNFTVTGAASAIVGSCIRHCRWLAGHCVRRVGRRCERVGRRRRGHVHDDRRRPGHACRYGGGR